MSNPPKATEVIVSSLLFTFFGLIVLIWSSYQFLANSSFPKPLLVIPVLIGGWSFIGGVSIFIRGEVSRQNATLFFGSLVSLYLIGELLINLFMWTGYASDEVPTVDSGFGAFNKPCAQFDTIRGFRWLPGEWRMTKVMNNEVLYDRMFVPNRQGYSSKVDYHRKKQNNEVFRFIVLGDSFTSGEYLEMPWSDKLNQLSKNKYNDCAEFYSFSINGGGIVNWHSIFHKEVAPNYEFDGVILAVFGNDLERNFFVMEHAQETGYAGYLDHIPVNRSQFLKNDLPKLPPLAPYKSDTTINKMVADARAYTNSKSRFSFKPDLYLFRLILFSPFIIQNHFAWRAFLNQHLSPMDREVTQGEILTSLGERKLQMLNEIIAYCTEHNKEVIISILPYEPAIHEMEKGKVLTYSLYCKYLTDVYGVNFFDGVTPFSSLTEQEVDDCFLNYDVHWTQKGSDFYADKIGEFIFDKLSICEQNKNSLSDH